MKRNEHREKKSWLFDHWFGRLRFIHSSPMHREKSFEKTRYQKWKPSTSFAKRFYFGFTLSPNSPFGTSSTWSHNNTHQIISAYHFSSIDDPLSKKSFLSSKSSLFPETVKYTHRPLLLLLVISGESPRLWRRRNSGVQHTPTTPRRKKAHFWCSPTILRCDGQRSGRFLRGLS